MSESKKKRESKDSEVEKKDKEPKKKSSLSESTSNVGEKKRERGKKKQQLMEELPEELSDSDEEEIEDSQIKITHVGYIEIKKKDRWTPSYCCLVGGTFYWYKSSQDVEPSGSINLKGLMHIKKIESGEGKKKWVLEIKSDTNTFMGSVGSSQELDTWLTKLTANAKLDPAPPPSKKKPKNKAVLPELKNVSQATLLLLLLENPSSKKSSTMKPQRC